MNTGKNTIPDISANVLRAEKNNGCVSSEKSDNRSCDKLDQYGDDQTKSNGLLESPSPRKIELITLYAVIKGIPRKQIFR